MPNDNLIHYPGQHARLRAMPTEAALLPNAPPATFCARSMKARDLARDIAKTEGYQTSSRQRK